MDHPGVLVPIFLESKRLTFEEAVPQAAAARPSRAKPKRSPQNESEPKGEKLVLGPRVVGFQGSILLRGLLLAPV